MIDILPGEISKDQGSHNDYQDKNKDCGRLVVPVNR